MANWRDAWHIYDQAKRKGKKKKGFSFSKKRAWPKLDLPNPRIYEPEPELPKIDHEKLKNWLRKREVEAKVEAKPESNKQNVDFEKVTKWLDSRPKEIKEIELDSQPKEIKLWEPGNWDRSTHGIFEIELPEEFLENNTDEEYRCSFCERKESEYFVKGTTIFFDKIDMDMCSKCFQKYGQKAIDFYEK